MAIIFVVRQTSEGMWRSCPLPLGQLLTKKMLDCQFLTLRTL
jgi:hypothetical protein